MLARNATPSAPALRLPMMRRVGPKGLCVMASREAPKLGSTRMDIQGRGGYEITPAITDHINQKIGHSIAQCEAVGIHEVSVRLSARGGSSKQHGEPLQKTEVTVHTKRGTLRAETAETNLYASIDKASDKIARQLKNLKEREAHGGVHTHHRMPAKINEVPHSEELVDDTPLFARGVAELPAEPVRTKYFAIERMSTAEAAQKLEDLDHAWLLFRAKDSGELQVLYRRNAGGFGVVIPKPEEKH